MKEFKKDPLRSRARRDVIRAIGDNEIVNKGELAELTKLSPLTINAIIREFRNYKLVTCHAGGLYALSGEGKEFYIQLLSDKRYRKRDYERRMKEKCSESEISIKRTIYIDENEEKDREQPKDE